MIFTMCSALILNHNTGDDYRLCGKRNVCVKKCCAENYVVKRKECVLTKNSTFSFDVYKETINVTSTDFTFYVIHDFNTNCKSKQNLRLDPRYMPEDEFLVQTDGSLYKPYDNSSNWIDFKDFCLDIFVMPHGEEFTALVCYEEEELEKIDGFCSVGKSYKYFFTVYLEFFTDWA